MDEDYEERRGRARGRPRGRQRGRPRAITRGIRISKRNKIESDEEELEDLPVRPAEVEKVPVIFDKDCDISALEAPTFTTLDRGPPAPMLQLSWNHPVNLIGEKVLSPRIHTCDSCDKPILLYGRMIPCKHVFCLWCAKSEDRVCARCGDRVARVEQTGLGTVFMCTFTINEDLCKRTYLSQRDLQAHIDHRHMKISKEDLKEERMSHRDPRAESDPRPPLRTSSSDPRGGGDPFLFPRSYNPNQPPPPQSSGAHHIPVMTSSRTNLITVPLQDPSEQQSYMSMSHPPPSFASPPPISQYSGFSTSAHPPQTSIVPPPPFASNIAPVPVPPPPSRPPYDNQYSQWSAPPPQSPISHPPPRHHPPPSNQQGSYYR